MYGSEEPKRNISASALPTEEEPGPSMKNWCQEEESLTKLFVKIIMEPSSGETEGS